MPKKAAVHNEQQLFYQKIQNGSSTLFHLIPHGFLKELRTSRNFPVVIQFEALICDIHICDRLMRFFRILLPCHPEPFFMECYKSLFKKISFYISGSRSCSSIRIRVWKPEFPPGAAVFYPSAQIVRFRKQRASHRKHQLLS